MHRAETDTGTGFGVAQSGVVLGGDTVASIGSRTRTGTGGKTDARSGSVQRLRFEGEDKYEDGDGVASG